MWAIKWRPKIGISTASFPMSRMAKMRFDYLWFDAGPASHNGVYGVTAIRVRLASAVQGAAVLVEAQDGTKTLLELSRPEITSFRPLRDLKTEGGPRRSIAAAFINPAIAPLAP